MRRYCAQEPSTSDPSDYDDIDDQLLALLEDDGADKVAAPQSATRIAHTPQPGPPRQKVTS